LFFVEENKNSSFVRYTYFRQIYCTFLILKTMGANIYSLLIRLAVFILLISNGIVLGQSANDTLACNSFCCCNNDPTPTGVMISHVHKKNEWMLSYRYMNMYMNGILSGTAMTLSNDVFLNYLMSPEKMSMNMHMLMGMYGITNNLTTMVMFNYNTISMDMNLFTAGSHHHNHSGGSLSAANGHHMESSGIGDIKVYALYSLIRREHHQLLLSTGLSLPSGTVKIKGAGDDLMYPNERLPYSMQLGSGTTDVLPSLSYLYQKERLTFSAQFSTTIRTAYNSVGYKLGNEATVNGWLAYRWWRSISNSLRIEGIAMNKIQGYDPALYAYNELSANAYNYGGQKINCYVGSVIQFKKGCLRNTRLGVEYGLPIYQNLTGTQMGLKHTLYASGSIMF